MVNKSVQAFFFPFEFKTMKNGYCLVIVFGNCFCCVNLVFFRTQKKKKKKGELNVFLFFFCFHCFFLE